MAIADEQFKHGFVISQIVLEISKINGLRVSVSNSITRSGYVVTVYKQGQEIAKFGLFIKFSLNRRSPWRYSVKRDHQTEIDLMYEEYREVFVALVNKEDGVACLNYELLKQILDDNHEETEWISVSSKLGSQYSLSGKDGKLNKKISRSDFLRSVRLYVESSIEKTGTDLHAQLEGV